MAKAKKGKEILTFQVQIWQARAIDNIARMEGTDRAAVIRGALYKQHPALVPRYKEKQEGSR
jgi:hypothetical protein